jgi:hypothetical protein
MADQFRRPLGVEEARRAAQGAGVGRLGQVRAEPSARQFLGNEPPAGGGLKAHSTCWPVKRASQARNSTRLAGLGCPRQVSPVSIQP